MLIDTRDNKSIEENLNGFEPSVQNQIIEAKCSTADIIGFVFICIFTLGLAAFYLIAKKNYFNEMQMKINEKASGIQIQLAQRRDTLIKLVDATKSSMNFENNLLIEITKLRSQKINTNNITKIDNELSNSYSKFLATFEQYPKLSSVENVKQLMSSAEYLEQELAASRRLYNSVVLEFNSNLFTFPARIPASNLKLHSFALFAATEEQQKDVQLTF